MSPFNLNKFESRQSGPEIKHVEEDGKRYTIRDGKRFEIGTLDQGPPAKTKRKAFEPEFAQLPLHWVKALRQAKNINTYPLAVAIQIEAFQRQRMGGEIVLSAVVTDMLRTNRHRAAMELERLGLIKLSQDGHRALRVILL